MVTDSTDPEVAMQELMGYAASIVEPGDTVVLAPAAASLDMYSGMSQRGNLFAHYAKEQL
jgi:UDP-N-acetylmuramoyl-L-alanine--D-glutamate ligase